MTSKSLAWQKRHNAQNRRTLKQDNRAAAEKAAQLGRPLNRREYRGFKLDEKSLRTPIKRLVVRGKRISAK
ncbi:MAG: hypothetical protein LBM73_01655 [Candidatus Nomurabacteria bacterium]|nr:hypothetical protein [Candidatus Nomurabacteria bacterium]